MKKRLLDRHGSGALMPCLSILIIAMMLSAILFFADSVAIVRSARDNTRTVLDGFVARNAILIFDSIKQGSDYIEDLDDSSYIDALMEFYEAGSEHEMLYRYDANGQILYRITCPQVEFASVNSLKLRADYDVIIPVTFAGVDLFDMRIPQRVTAYYNLK
jgi:hypothetical protein